METVDMSNNLPEQEVAFFRDAIIAHQSGKTLAGLFFLRTFIEQFARRVIGETGRRAGDEIMQVYTKTLPEAIRPTMPSLGPCYVRLSEALHGADADATVFDEMRQKIEQHFDSRAAARL